MATLLYVSNQQFMHSDTLVSSIADTRIGTCLNFRCCDRTRTIDRQKKSRMRINLPLSHPITSWLCTAGAVMFTSGGWWKRWFVDCIQQYESFSSFSKFTLFLFPFLLLSRCRCRMSGAPLFDLTRGCSKKPKRWRIYTTYAALPKASPYKSHVSRVQINVITRVKQPSPGHVIMQEVFRTGSRWATRALRITLGIFYYNPRLGQQL